LSQEISLKDDASSGTQRRSDLDVLNTVGLVTQWQMCCRWRWLRAWSPPYRGGSHSENGLPVSALWKHIKGV